MPNQAAMKRFIPAFLILLAILIGYWAWPFFALRALAAALQAGDMPAINEEVDYTRVRRSFTEQIIGAYLRVTGRASQLGALAPLATAAGASIVDPGCRKSSIRKIWLSSFEAGQYRRN
jgi:hypothetical protein